MKKRFTLFVAIAIAMVAMDWSAAGAQSLPLCELLGCPPGPQGPAGGLDASRLYVKECLDTTACSCDAAADVLLNGGAACDPGSQVLLASKPSTSVGIWNASCWSLIHSEIDPAPIISITCLDSSEN